MTNRKESSGIVYSCYHTQSRDGEQFVPEHTLSFQINGSLVLSDGLNEYTSNQGSFRLIRRNQLLKFVKHPPRSGDFKSINIYLKQNTLKDFSSKYDVRANPAKKIKGVFEIKMNALLEVFITSLLAYEKVGGLNNEALIKVKTDEAILLLLQTNPALKDVLFDFSDPHKLDLEAFMNQNYHFNVRLERFAYLTGRSLATFKRDFERTFKESPRKWLQRKRLQQAHYLISRRGKSASEIYLDLGFEDLTHFSHAFKKEYGLSPKNVGVAVQ